MIMLFRRLGESFFFKIILLCIAVSMVSLWGVSDMVTRLGRKDTLIEVGNEKINAFRLRQEFDKDIQKYRALMGNQPFTQKQALSMGLLEQTMARVVLSSLKRQMVEDFGTIASDDSVRQYLLRNENFQNMLGHFDRGLLHAYLRKMNLSEKEFIASLQQELAERHLFDATGITQDIPLLLTQSFYKYAAEKRNVSFIEVKADDLKVTSLPTKEEKQAYYDSMRQDLVFPETRDVSYILVTPKGVEGLVNVSQEEVDEAYQTRKASLVIPETRQVLQIKVSSLKEAEDLKKGLTSKNFEQVAKEKAGQTEQETDFGWVSKDQLLTELSTPLFKAKKGEVIGPVETSLGVHLLCVKDIKAAVYPKEKEVKESLFANLKKEKSFALAEAKRVEAENALALGKDIVSISKELNLPLLEKKSLKIEGEKEGLFANASLMQEIFITPKGTLLRPMDVNGGLLVASVEEITPLTYKTLKQSEKEILDVYKKDKQKVALKELSSQFEEKIKTSFKDLAQKTSLPVQTEKEISRSGKGIFQGQLLDKVFKTKKGENFVLSLEGEVVLGKVDTVLLPKETDKKDFKVFVQNFARQLSLARTDEMISFYANKLGVKIDYKLISETFKTVDE
ncbi:MAG: hypothetical protein EOM53_02940 [Alphaproteobacteria bacterium]|nr:hypothetical protein [Alphaproteobacteria bacterium]